MYKPFHSSWSLLGISLVLLTGFNLFEYLLLTILDKSYVDMCRWDCGWYRGIAGLGYALEPSGHGKGDAANWAFFPLFPILARIAGEMFLLNDNHALIVVSKLFAWLSVFSFLLLTRVLKSTISPWTAGSIMVCSPYFIYGNSGYSESLFFFLSSLSLYFLDKKQFLYSGVFAGFLSATRIVGGSMGFSYLIAAFSGWRQRDRRGEILLGLCLIPLGLAIYMLFLHNLMGDALAFLHVQVAWRHAPGDVFWQICDAVLHPIRNWSQILAMGHVVFAFFALWFLWRKKYYELFVFSLVATLIPLFTGLVSMPRYIWWQPPILCALVMMLSLRKPLLYIYIVAGAVYSVVVYIGWLNNEHWVV